jgi:hypothetical protein
VYAKSPLAFDTATGTFGLPSTFTTGAVRDPDAYYNWDFGYCQKISTSNVLNCTLATAKNGDWGKLWVFDTLGNTSPVINFTINMIDTVKPIIRSLVGNDRDTIKTADPLFAFMVYIADYGNYTVDSASINNAPFDTVNYGQNIYKKIIPDMKQYETTPYTANILAINNIGSGTEKRATRTFRIFYDTSSNQTPNTTITVKNISDKDTLTQMSYISILGDVESIIPTRITMKIYINGIDQQRDTLYQTGTGEWRWLDLPLFKETLNNLVITASDSQGTVVADDTIRIYHYSNYNDSINPAIWEIKVNDMLHTATPIIYTARDSANLKVTAYDNISGIKKVYAGVTEMTRINDLLWEADIPVEHNPSADKIKITLFDNFGNKADTSILVIQNAFPILERDLQFPNTIIADSTYTDTLMIYDSINENDRIHIECLNCPPHLSIDSAGAYIFDWRPLLADTGKDTISFQIHNTDYEDFNKVKTYTWDYEIKEKIIIGPPVEFLTTADSFPPYIEVDKTPLDINLLLKDSTGTAPFHYSARVTTLNISLLDNSPRNRLQWNPGIRDTGTHQLMVLVHDWAQTSDTIFCLLPVVPANSRPCSLSVRCSTATIHNDTLDLTGVTDSTIDCIYTITDNDHPLTEEFSVVSEGNGSSSSFYTKSKVFTISVKPEPGNPGDSLVVTVKDKTNSIYKLSLVIKHPAENILLRSLNKNKLLKRKKDFISGIE